MCTSSSGAVDVEHIQLRAKIAHRNEKRKHESDYGSYVMVLLVVLITVFTYPTENMVAGGVTLQHVFYCGWITAIATGAGVLPFFFLSKPNKFWMGISNGIFDFLL
jgi:hypothetical protein